MIREARGIFLSALAFLALAVGHAAANGVATPQFVEETQGAGIASVYDGDWEFMVGGGAATFDCNADGFPDMLLAGGKAPANFYRNAATRGGPLKFERQASGLESDGVTGAYPLDIDGDGMTDIVLLRVGENIVMRGLGECQFERANETWGFDGGDAWSAAMAATWEKGAQWPTIAIGNYIDRREELEPWGSCTDNWLHRPAANGAGFAAPVPLTPSYCALSMLFTDWNRSGTPSLRVSNDREYYEGGDEQLWRIEPGQAPSPYTEADGWKRVRIWGMGIASADLDGNGYPDYFLTSMADNRLQMLATVPPEGAPQPDFKEVALAKGLTAHRPYTGGDLRPSTAWHAQFEDVNNDGFADLFVAKGNVAKMPDFAQADPNNLLLQGADGKFVEAGDRAGVASMAIARGAMLADFNLDGLLDLVVVNRWETAQLWRNTSDDAGNWVQVRLRQDGANRDGIGARIEIRHGGAVIGREIAVGGGHASGHSGWWHFGLGMRTETELRVIWPDGEAGPWLKAAANAFYTIERGKELQAWTPR